MGSSQIFYSWLIITSSSLPFPKIPFLYKIPGLNVDPYIKNENDTKRIFSAMIR